jgi:hypothetical protein
MQEWEYQDTGQYKLINLDKDESSIVRRALYQRSQAGEQAIRRLVLAIQDEHGLPDARIMKPCWWANAWPLLYWAKDQRAAGSTEVYGPILDFLLEGVPTSDLSLPRDLLRPAVVDCEIDILVEDSDYFAFLEVKISTPDEQARFPFHRNRICVKGEYYSVHQMVRQYVQGRMLQKKRLLPHKTFALATVGAHNEQPSEIELNGTERELLGLVGEGDKESLVIIDLPLKTLTGAALSAP